MCSKRIEGLPFLPGNAFADPTVMDYRKCQIFDHVNGFRRSKNDYLGIGSIPIPEKAMTVKDIFDAYNYDPAMTYGIPRPTVPNPVVPAFVALEKKVLKFNAYYKETVNDSAVENYRVRPVEIFYYLEDDSIMVSEPRVENSGLMQGKFLRRHRVPKNDIGETWHWKDLNTQCEVMFYGRVFRITDVDQWTRSYYDSEGVILNTPERLPKDPYTDKRFSSLQKRVYNTPDMMYDVRKKFMEYEKKTLVFNCIWDDRETSFGYIRKFKLLYHLADDCVEVNEVLEQNSGRDPSTLLLRKTKLPRNWRDLPAQFPIISLEPTERDIVNYYEPKDFKLGATIMVFGRRFLVYDMDEFTKQFYRDHFGYTDFTPICIDQKKPTSPEIVFDYRPTKPPPWNGWGSPEDSLQSWLHIVPQRPRYDAMKRLLFELKVLKFAAVMDSTRPEDQGREFTISYRLVDDKMSVYERPVRNSGWPGGKFLDYCLIMKSGSSKDNPEYYGPHDLYIGAMLDIFGHRFCLNAADPFVLEFMNTNPDCFPEHVKQNIQEYFECENQQNPVTTKTGKECDPGPPVCEEPIGEGFFEHLGLGSQKLTTDPCGDNPNPYPMSYDWDMCRTLGYNCGVQRPQQSMEELEPIDQVCEKPCPGNEDMFEEKSAAVCVPERYVAPNPVMANPVLTEELQCIPSDKYYQLKERRFDCYNPPDPDQQFENYQKSLRYKCPCPPDNQQQ